MTIALLSRLRPRRSVAPRALTRFQGADHDAALVEIQRFLAPLQYVTDSDPLYSYLSDCVERLGPSEELAHLFLPHLGVTPTINLLLNRPVAGLTLLDRQPSPALIDAAVAAHDTHLFVVTLAAHMSGAYPSDHATLALPRWYLYRLLLRVPHLAGLVLEYSVNLYAGPVRSLITRLSPDPNATIALLTNPAVSLAQALSATAAMERS